MHWHRPNRAFSFHYVCVFVCVCVRDGYTVFGSFCLIVSGVVGCGEGIMYLTSLGRPTDIGLQVGQGLLSL